MKKALVVTLLALSLSITTVGCENVMDNFKTSSEDTNDDAKSDKKKDKKDKKDSGKNYTWYGTDGGIEGS